MALTPYTPTTWVNDSEPDLEADNLNKIEQGIANAIDGVNGILNALTNQLSTDQTKFAGIAVVNTLNTALNNLSNTVSILNSNFTWKTLGSIDLLVAENIYSISYAGISINELLISYGTKNGTQTFGGGTVIFNPSESKPCFLPIYNSSNNFISSIYIFNDPSQQSLTVSRGSASADFRVNVFYR